MREFTISLKFILDFNNQVQKVIAILIDQRIKHKTLKPSTLFTAYVYFYDEDFKIGEAPYTVFKTLY